MENLSHFVQRLGRDWSCQIKEFSPTQFGVDVPIKLKDGRTRYQMVYITAGGNEERPFFDVSSRMGLVQAGIKIWDLLEEAGRYCNYTGVFILQQKLETEQLADVLWLGCRPLAKHTSDDLMKDIVWETAVNADYFEEKYFGGVDAS
jgi:hypothetical protein